MAVGFIRDKFELKYLLLFVLSSVKQPMSVDDIVGATSFDETVTYFQASEAFYELIETGHIQALSSDDGQDLYTLTEKGKTRAAEAERRLPSSVRRDAQKSILCIATKRNRDAMISTSTEQKEDGTYTVKLSMRDDSGVVLSMDFMVVSRTQGQIMESNFRENAEQIYGRVVDAVLRDYNRDELQ